MTAAQGAGLSDELAALLAEHQYIPSGLRGVSKCACGIQFHGMPHDHRAHLAELLARRERTAVADALADAVVAILRKNDAHLPAGCLCLVCQSFTEAARIVGARISDGAA